MGEKIMLMTCFGQKCISVSLNIGRIRMMEECVDWFVFAGRERDTIVLCGVNIVGDVQGGLNMT